MLYRIYTENKNFDDVIRIAGCYFDGFTVLTGKGFWQGESEDSLILEVIGENLDRKVKELAEDIKVLNQQDCVLIQKVKNQAEFV